MAATEDISLRIALDDRQAQAGLDALRQETASLAATAEGAAGGIGSISSKVDKFKGTIEPTATAVNGMASAFGGLNTQTGAVLGGVSNLASAFMAGGPLALGLVTIGTAVSAVTTAYQENKKAAEEAAKKQQEAINKIVEVGLGPLEAATFRLNQAKKELELQNMLTGKDSDQLINAMRPIVLEIESLNAQIGAAQREIKRLKLEAVEGIRKGESIEQMKARRKEAEKLIEPMETQLSLLRQAKGIEIERIKIVDQSTRAMMDRTKALEAEAKAEKDAQEAKKEAERAAKESEKNQKYITKTLREQIKKRQQEREKEMAENAKVGPTRDMFDKEQMRLAGEMEKARVDAARKAAKERIKIEEEVARRTEEINKKTANISVEIATGAVGLLTGAANEIFTGIMSGREDVVEMATANFLSGLGSQLVGIGTKALIEGAIISANPFTPGAGAPMMALGGLAVAAGIGMGGVGAAISSSIGSTTAPAGGGAATTATPMGAGRISTGSTGDRDRGGMEQVTYVFNAPVFGDQNRSARHVAMLQRRGQRDLLLA